VEILVMEVSSLALRDLAELEHFTNTTDFTLKWMWSPSIEEVLQMLKRWRQLRRLTLQNDSDTSVPQFEELANIIMEMKHLSYLHIDPPGEYDFVLEKYDHTNFGLMEILRDKVHEFILPRRPNFKFDISSI
jgi:hypothetical protein